MAVEAGKFCLCHHHVYGVYKMSENQSFTLKQKAILVLLILCFVCTTAFLCLQLLIAALISLGGVMLFYGWLFHTEIDTNTHLRGQLDTMQEKLEELENNRKKTSAASSSGYMTVKKLGELENELKAKEELLTSVSEKYESLLSASAEASKVHEASEDAAMASLLPPVSDSEASETVDIIHITQTTIDELRPFAVRSGIEIRLGHEKDQMFVKANRERLHIMFRNIIDNSIKYMGKQGFLQITISNIDDDIFIILKDNGYGLSSDETSHIFELNYQGSNRISGNGLGLTQAKAIVNYYGGTIYARSTSGNGMGIYIQLPTNEITGGGQ